LTALSTNLGATLWP